MSNQRKSISWILDFTSKLPNAIEKVKCLKANDIKPIRTVLQYALHPGIVWDLPAGDPPYTPCTEPYHENILYQEARRLYIFIVNPQLNIPKSRKESMFIQMLNDLDPEDAKLILAAKDKKLPYPGLTPLIIKQAYPGIL